MPSEPRPAFELAMAELDRLIGLSCGDSELIATWRVRQATNEGVMVIGGYGTWLTT